MTTQPTIDAPERIARLFHETYEQLAPQYGYETRPDTKAFDPTSANGRLMMAVCKTIAETEFWAGGRTAEEWRDRVRVLNGEIRTLLAASSGEREKALLRDFEWRAMQCRTNPDAFDETAAGVWDLAAQAVREKCDAF